MPNEVEIKFRVADVPTLEQRLRDAGFHVVTPRTHELNMLYDFGNGRLRKAGQLLRLRQYGQKWTLATHVEDVTPREMAKRAQAFYAKMAGSQ